VQARCVSRWVGAGRQGTVQPAAWWRASHARVHVCQRRKEDRGTVGLRPARQRERERERLGGACLEVREGEGVDGPWWAESGRRLGFLFVLIFFIL
jgi:hypothetical protein